MLVKIFLLIVFIVIKISTIRFIVIPSESKHGGTTDNYIQFLSIFSICLSMVFLFAC